jgi:hypothetical protein
MSNKCAHDCDCGNYAPNGKENMCKPCRNGECPDTDEEE